MIITSNENEKYIRLCPLCNNELCYKHLFTMIKQENNNSLCRKCTAKNKNITEESKQSMKKKLSIRFSGENNPMYRKTFKDSWKNNGLSEEEIKIKSKEHSEKTSKAGIGRIPSNKGLSYVEDFINKGLSLDEATEKSNLIKQKISIASRGENNGMFGKPSPKKSGNGWQGYYKDYYFRSLMELSYIIYLEENNIAWESGEQKKHRISYIFENTNKNYFPDFYLIKENKYIEIKPKRLTSNSMVLAKMKAMKDKKLDIEIKTQDDIEILTSNKIDLLISNNNLIFIPSSLLKFEKYKNARK